MPVVPATVTMLPDATGGRRGDPAIADIDLGGGDIALVGLDDALVLLDQLRLIVGLLPRDRVLRRQGLIALQIDLRLFQQGLVLPQGPLGLGEDGLVGCGIDLGEHGARPHVGALRRDKFQLAGDLGVDGHRLPGLGRADGGDHHGYVLDRRLGRGHGN
jgi:hypothetical protein